MLDENTLEEPSIKRKTPDTDETTKAACKAMKTEHTAMKTENEGDTLGGIGDSVDSGKMSSDAANEDEAEDHEKDEDEDESESEADEHEDHDGGYWSDKVDKIKEGENDSKNDSKNNGKDEMVFDKFDSSDEQSEFLPTTKKLVNGFDGLVKRLEISLSQYGGAKATSKCDGGSDMGSDSESVGDSDASDSSGPIKKATAKSQRKALSVKSSKIKKEKVKTPKKDKVVKVKSNKAKPTKQKVVKDKVVKDKVVKDKVVKPKKDVKAKKARSSSDLVDQEEVDSAVETESASDSRSLGATSPIESMEGSEENDAVAFKSLPGSHYHTPSYFSYVVEIAKLNQTVSQGKIPSLLKLGRIVREMKSERERADNTRDPVDSQ